MKRRKVKRLVRKMLAGATIIPGPPGPVGPTGIAGPPCMGPCCVPKGRARS